MLPDKGMLHIHQALEEVEKKHRTDRRFRLGDTKNEESERYAPAIQEVFACFKELEEIQVENGWRDNAYKKGNGSLVIIDRNGEIVDKRAFNRNLGLYLVRRGFNKKLTLHMPRHCYTTYLKWRSRSERKKKRYKGLTGREAHTKIPEIPKREVATVC